nr:HAD-IIIC family phosphatase [Acetobacter sp. P5B1]
MQFGAGGRILGYSHSNEHSWKIIDNVLHIYAINGQLMWRFDNIYEGAYELMLISGACNDPDWGAFFGLSTKIEDIKSIKFSKEKERNVIIKDRIQENKEKKEGIRLVIWDLDDTFWAGTLSEGEIDTIDRNIEIVKTLNRRGIVNAICSRNTFEDVKEKLESLDLWNEFVFPRIAWGAKGPLVKDIVEKIQLRPETVLFVDDNVTNLNEVKHFVPEINIAEPDVLDGLLDDPRFKGKPDPDRSRLQRYQVLESKHNDMVANGGDNEEFLRKSNIRVSFHSDIEEEFTRIHDLVNRTNQLNFTKNRWPEDIEEARLKFREELNADFDTDVGYVKVSDAYGNYGICGFYLSRKKEFLHFLFSCRTMNMGVEQFVWRKLGERYVPIQGKVGASLDVPVVDWISVVEDADKTEEISSASARQKKVCIRGACDLMMTSNFLRTRLDTIEEFNYPYDEWEVVTTPRIIALHKDLKNLQNREIISQLPGIPANRFDSAVISEEADVYVLSFSQESFHGLYCSRTTGMIMPFGTYHFPYYLPGGPKEKFDYTSLSYEDVLSSGMKNVSKEQWAFFKKEFEFIGGFNKELFIQDLRYLFNRLINTDKKVIILGLNEKIGRDWQILSFFAEINAIVRPLVNQYGFCYIEMTDFVSSEDDLAQDGVLGGAHFNRSVYKAVADKILNEIEG